MSRVYYLDTSAVLKLFADESSATEFRDFWTAHADDAYVSSSLLRVELSRSVSRSYPAQVQAAGRLLREVEHVPMNDSIIDAAIAEPDRQLRSLDAIHLASARILLPDLTALVTYDRRLADAASQAGMTVLAPGLD